MTTKEFIEKAIDGGFNIPGGADCYTKDEEYFLNPLAWQAVGKVEGWGSTHDQDGYLVIHDWKRNMHRMIDALCEGKSVESFLSTL